MDAIKFMSHLITNHLTAAEMTFFFTTGMNDGGAKLHFFKINLMILIAQEIKHVHVTGD